MIAIFIGRAAPGHERRELIDSLQRQLKVSRQHVYTLAKRGGWQSGRKTRADKGQPALMTGGYMSAIYAKRRRRVA